MALAHEADDVTGPIYDHREESSNVSAEHAHVQHLGISDGGKLAAKCHLPGLSVGKADRRFDQDRVHHAAQATQALIRRQHRNPKRRQNVGTQDRSIGAGIDEK